MPLAMKRRRRSHRGKWLATWLVALGCGTNAAPQKTHEPQLAATTSAAPSAQPSALAGTPAPLELTDEELCALPVSEAAAAVPGAKPFTKPDAFCSGGWECDFIDRAPAGGGACFVANDNILKAEKESRAASAPPASPSGAWDGVKKPLYLDRIDAHLHLTATEHERLRDNGFVVLDRLPYVSYPAAFHDIYQEQLPLYVGIDPILHAVFRGTERALERVERKELVPALATLLRKLRSGLKQHGKRYRPEIRADLDLYLGVAWLLHHGDDAVDDKALSVFGAPQPIVELYARVGSESLEEVSMFGRQRMVDFSQLRPRGHYEYSAPSYEAGNLQTYFRTVMWLSRLELNLVSRDCRSSQPGTVKDPAETPREVLAALALAEIAAASGATQELRAFERVYGEFAGSREDVSMGELTKLARGAGTNARDADAPAKLKRAIGSRYARTANTHYMPEGVKRLPVIATLLGPRIAPDVAPLTQLAHGAIPGRDRLGAADVAYLLGHDRAKVYLASELRAHAGLDAALQKGRNDVASGAAGGKDLYGSWLRAILALGPAPAGVVPSFMQRDAHADARMSSALVGYGQLRHTYVLLAGQGYDMYGCEIPDAYVEPLPAVYDALLAHVRALRKRAKGWDGLERVLAMLQSIVKAEVGGAALSEPQKRWLAMVAEHIPIGGFADTGEPPKWTGWYFDMFDDRELGANQAAAFVADYFTLTNAGEVAYLGAEGPRLGVFVVDVGGEPRAMVGPVAKGYEATKGPIHERLTDESARGLSGTSAPWRSSYAVAEAAAPAVGLGGKVLKCERPAGPEWIVAMRGDRALDTVRVTLLDHHGDALTEPLAVPVTDAWKAYRFELPAAVSAASFGVEAYHLHLADPSIAGGYDYFTTPSVYREDEEGLPVRPQGLGAFAIGASGGR